MWELLCLTIALSNMQKHSWEKVLPFEAGHPLITAPTHPSGAHIVSHQLHITIEISQPNVRLSLLYPPSLHNDSRQRARGGFVARLSRRAKERAVSLQLSLFSTPRSGGSGVGGNISCTLFDGTCIHVETSLSCGRDQEVRVT